MPTKLNAQFGSEIPAHPVLPGKIKEMTERYRTTCSKGDARSCWVSMSEVLQLIADNGANGIRIYYGRHGDNDGTEFKNKHNVILVATHDSVTPTKPTSENSADLLNAVETDAHPANSVIVSFEGMGDDVIPLCPPHCPKTMSILSTE